MLQEIITEIIKLLIKKIFKFLLSYFDRYDKFRRKFKIFGVSRSSWSK